MSRIKRQLHSHSASHHRSYWPHSSSTALMQACKRGAPQAVHKQALQSSVFDAIIANSIALDTALKAACTARVFYSFHDADARKRTTERTLSLSAVASAAIFTIDHISPSCFTGFSFLTTLVATRRCRCLLRSARVNVMPEPLLSVISGILAGEIPGFRIELCCFLHPLTWSLVFFCGLFVLLLVRGHSQ